MESTHHASSYDHSTRGDVRTFLSWSAPGRPFRPKSKQFYATTILLLMLIEIILFLFSMYLLMLVAVSLTFLFFVLNTIPPKEFHYRISSEGIKIEEHFYIWNELYEFYFREIDGVDTLILRTEAFLPGEISITLGSVSRSHVRKILIHYLPYREYVRPTFVEKWGDWLSRNFPLERT